MKDEIVEVMARARWNANIGAMNARQPLSYEAWPEWDALEPDSVMRTNTLIIERAALDAAGYVVVPKSPTPAMWDAGAAAYQSPAAIWHAMLKAAQETRDE